MEACWLGYQEDKGFVLSGQSFVSSQEGEEEAILEIQHLYCGPSPYLPTMEFV